MSSVLGIVPPTAGFTDFINTNAAADPHRLAVVCGAERRTWGEFRQATNQVANALLDSGIVKGDRVAMIMHNSVEAFDVLWGIIRAGAIVMPLSSMSSTVTLELQIGHASPAAVFCDSHGAGLLGDYAATRSIRSYVFADSAVAGWDDAPSMISAASDADPDVVIAPEDSISLLYTSGTTGAPKGIEHTHLARLRWASDYALCLHIDRQSTSISSTPLYTNGTWTTMLPTVAAGGTVVLVDKFEPNVLIEQIETHGVTHAFLVPTQLGRIMASDELAKHDLSSLQTVLTGAAPITSELLAAVADQLPTTRVCENWGCTEGFSTFVPPISRSKDRLTTVGIPMRGTEVKAIDGEGNEAPRGTIGELVGWGGALMKGYYLEPQRTEELIWRAPDGRTFLRSGDLGYVDEGGFVFLSGRVKDMILSGGINVFPADIEEVMQRHPDVLEAVVIGVPHSDWGETPLAFVRVREDSATTTDELKHWTNGQLGKYQRISGVEIRTEFPRTSYNKVLKRELRERYLEPDRTTANA